MNFKYRWKIKGNEYVGSKKFSCREELLQHIAELGGELIEILEPSIGLLDRQKYCGETGGDTIDSAIVINTPTHAMGVLQEYEYIDQLHGKWHDKWEIKSRRVFDRRERYYEEFEIILKNGLSEKICFDITAFYGKSDWVVVNDWDGGTTYVDKSGIRQVGVTIFVPVRYRMNTPGIDKINNKQVKEMLILEEYDMEEKKLRFHKMLFTYIDGSVGAPGEPVPEWTPVGKGHDATLRYLETWKLR